MYRRKPWCSEVSGTVALTPILLACLLLLRCSLFGEVHVEEERGIVKEANDDYVRGSRERQIPYRTRELQPGEIGASRGEVEDKLRREVLEVFLDEQRLGELRGVLNRPWDKAGVEYLWALVEQYEAQQAYAFVSSLQKLRVLNLLAYVSVKHRSSEVAEVIRRRFDSLLLRIARPEVQPPVVDPANRHKFCAYVLDAIEQHGSVELLGPGFWECFETYRDASVGVKALRTFGDHAALERLKRLDKVLNAWGVDSYSYRVRMLCETIRAIEERLARAREENDDKK